MSVNRSSENGNMLSHALLSFLFFSHGFIQIRFGLFELWVTNIIYQNLMLLNFQCWETSFSVNIIFVNDEKHTQWNLDTKAKVFHERNSCFMKCRWNCISWNALKEKLHCVYFHLGNKEILEKSQIWVDA